MIDFVKAKLLIAKLVGNDVHKNLDTIEQLAEIGHPSAIGPILNSLKGLNGISNKDRLSEAIASFGADAVGPLIEMLSDDGPSTRGLAATTLGRIGDARVIGPLVRLQLDRYPGVVSDALRALKNIDEDWARTNQARQAMADLLEVFHTGDSYHRLLAAEVLDTIDPNWTANVRTQELTDALLDSLCGPPSWTTETLKLLKRFCPQWHADPRARKAVPILTERLRKGRRAPEFCEALAAIGDTTCIDDLICSIPGQGQAALDALEAIDPNWRQSVTREHLQGLFALLFRPPDNRQSGLSAYQENTATGLAGIGSELVVNTLIWAMEQGLRQEAEDRAKRQPRAVDADGLSPLGESLQDQTERLLSQFRPTPKPVEPKLDLSLVPETLGKIGNAKALGILVSTLNSENRQLQRAAADALGAIGEPTAIAPLTMMLAAPPEDNYYVTSDRAAWAIKRIDPNWHQTEWAKQGIGPLIRQLASTNRRTRDRAASFLNEIGPSWMETPQARQAIPALINALHIRPSLNWQSDGMDGYGIGLFRAGLADTLLGIGDARAIWPLLEVSRDGRGAAELVKCAQQLLERHASQVSEDDLRKTVEMEAVEHIHFKAQCDFMLEDHREPVDLSLVRQMARQELLSRK